MCKGPMQSSRTADTNFDCALTEKKTHLFLCSFRPILYLPLCQNVSFQSNYKLHKLDPLGETSQRETGSPADAESKVDVTSALGEDVDPYDYEDEEEEEDYPIEYKYVVNPRKSSMDLINSVEDFTDRSGLVTTLSLTQILPLLLTSFHFTPT